MIKFKWSGKMSVDFEEMDKQHKEVFNLFNGIHKAKEKNIVQDIVSAVDDLLEYWKVHFGYEEELMKQHGYSDYSDHKSEHHHIHKEISTIQSLFSSGNKDSYDRLIAVLNMWTEHHLANRDRKLGEYLKSKGLAQ